MMAANLVGFVVGIDGMKHMASQLVGSWAGACVTINTASFSMLTCDSRHTVYRGSVRVSLRRGAVDVRVQVRSCLHLIELCSS